MKVGFHLQYLFMTSSHLFASSFLQGAHSNTAVRNHYYDAANSFLKAQSLVQGYKTLTSTTTNGIHVSSSTRLFGFFNPFEFNSNDNTNDDDDNDNNEEEEEEEELRFSSSDLDKARQSFEDMFTMPNDNIDTSSTSSSAHFNANVSNTSTNSNKSSKSKSSPSASSSASSSSSMYMKSSDEEEEATTNPNNTSSDNNVNTNNSNNNHKNKLPPPRREILTTKTRDISKIAQSIPPPPLTAIAHERSLREITLLSTLTESDHAINELWALWISERGPAAATILLRAEQLMSHESYDEAERLLWSLIHIHGVYWAEPVNRLATLKYMQGELEESKALCEVVLQTKPWHFGALSGIVLVCTALNDATGARLWAERRLPPLIPEHTSGDRRVKWISRALNDAAGNLERAAKVGRGKEIGKEETEFRTLRAKMQQMAVDVEDEDRKNDEGKSEGGGRDGVDNLDAWQ